jgi:predicted anti-sigma-YlaC factor YlaD
MGILLDCRDAVRLISRELDGPLPAGRRLRLRLHLLWCAACRGFARQAAFLRMAMQRYRE